MTYRYETMTAIAAERVIAIVRASTEREGATLVSTLVDAGLGVVEVTMSTPGALRTIEAHRDSDALIGAGTVLTEGEVAQVAAAGGRFVVTPNLDERVVRAAHRHGLAILAGCATPTEITLALEYGVDAIKVFPASAYGMEFLTAVRAPLPWAPLIPTGGVTMTNAPQWIDAGAVAVGMGGALTAGDTEDVRRRALDLRSRLSH